MFRPCLCFNGSPIDLGKAVKYTLVKDVFARGTVVRREVAKDASLVLVVHGQDDVDGQLSYLRRTVLECSCTELGCKSISRELNNSTQPQG